MATLCAASSSSIGTFDFHQCGDYQRSMSQTVCQFLLSSLHLHCIYGGLAVSPRALDLHYILDIGIHEVGVLLGHGFGVYGYIPGHLGQQWLCRRHCILGIGFWRLLRRFAHSGWNNATISIYHHYHHYYLRPHFEVRHEPRLATARLDSLMIGPSWHLRVKTQPWKTEAVGGGTTASHSRARRHQ